MTYTVLSVGDSIMWGQGLNTTDKFAYSVADEITKLSGSGTTSTVHQYAHSTATVWKNGPFSILKALHPCPEKLAAPRTPGDAEIEAERMPDQDPVERDKAGELIRMDPYTWNQLFAAKKHLGDARIDLVLLNGGINDVGLLNLFLPYKDPYCVLARIMSFRGTILHLLSKTHSYFPGAKIIVAGYYAVLSEMTDFTFFRHWISGFSEAVKASLSVSALSDSELPREVKALFSTTSVLGALDIERFCLPILRSFSASTQDVLASVSTVDDHLIALSRMWKSNINELLQQEVNLFNDAIGVKTAALAVPAYKPENSLYAPHSWLWELDDDLEPVDPIKDLRKHICQKDPLLYYICYRASLGHPNPAGANAYKEAILSQLKGW